MTPDAHLLNQALEDQTDTVSLVLTFLIEVAYCQKLIKYNTENLRKAKEEKSMIKFLIMNIAKELRTFFMNGYQGKSLFQL